MNKLQIRVLAVTCWLVALVLLIPPLAIHSEWTPWRDGKHVTGTIERVEPSRSGTYYRVEVRFGEREHDVMRYFPREAPAGKTVELVVHERGYDAIPASELDAKRPSPLLWLMFAGIPILGWLGLMLWRAPTRAARRRAARTAPLDALVDAVRFTRNVSIGLALFFAASTVFIAIVPIFDRTATVGMIVTLEVLAAMCLGLAVWCVHRAVKMRDPKQSPVFELIEQRPTELAWFYVQEVRAQLGQRGYSLHLWKTNGKQLALNLVAEDIDAVLAAIAKHAPEARQGYSPELQREYKQRVASR